MPELPEVETCVRELEPELKNRQVTEARVFWERTIAAPSAHEFANEIIGQRFTYFGRRGKYMLFGLESGQTLMVHLRMTGKLQIEQTGIEPDKHTHVVLGLDDSRCLHYRDPRKFGRLWLVQDPMSILYKLGPEPLDDSFTADNLATKLTGRQASIKALLLNQSVIAGVGNIYADEALFLARIHPARPGGALTSTEIEQLYHAVRTVLRRGIELQGSTLGGSKLQNYLRPGGESGGFQTEHQVFGRKGQPCPRCGCPIERIILAQRSSHFCPQCQPSG
jgi:formamidopyrimidine-DNA glycosylase